MLQLSYIVIWDRVTEINATFKKGKIKDIPNKKRIRLQLFQFFETTTLDGSHVHAPTCEKETDWKLKHKKRNKSILGFGTYFNLYKPSTRKNKCSRIESSLNISSE